MNTALPIDRTSGEAIQVGSPVTRDASDTTTQITNTITATAQAKTIATQGTYLVDVDVPTRIEIRRAGLAPTAATATTGMRLYASNPRPFYFQADTRLSIIRDTTASGDGTLVMTLL